MRKILFLFTAILFFTASGQTPNWAWGHGGGGNTNANYGNDKGNSLITDSYGNVYTIGNFQSTQLVFGSYTLINSANSGDSADVFIAKYDAAGIVLWAKSITGVGNEGGYGIAVDGANNIYVTGSFNSSSIDFGSKILSKTSTQGMNDIFIAKFSSSGNVIWAKGYGGLNDDFGNAITIDLRNDIYISGSFKSQSFLIGSDSLINDSTIYSNMFIAKYDSSGNELYAKRVGKSCSIAFTGCNIANDGNNNLFVTGSYSNSQVIIGNDTLVNKGGQDVFIAKYNSLGNILWAKSAGGNSTEEANSIAIDANSNTYITGYFDSQPLVIGNYTLTTVNLYDIFIAKYDSMGNVVWAKSLGTINPNGIIHGPSIATDVFGDVYVTGGYINQTPLLVFGNDTLFNAGPGNDDIFIGKFSSSGIPIWGKKSSGLSNDWDQTTGITTDIYGNIFITGFYASHQIVFGNDTLANLNHYYYYTAVDYFIAKIGTAGVGIEPFSNSHEISIYPNPTSGSFTVSDIDENTEIRVTDVVGQTIYESKGIGNPIDLSTQNPGIYFISAIAGQKKYTGKLIVNK